MCSPPLGKWQRMAVHCMALSLAAIAKSISAFLVGKYSMVKKTLLKKRKF
jgi:hypothetical protein